MALPSTETVGGIQRAGCFTCWPGTGKRALNGRRRLGVFDIINYSTSTDIACSKRQEQYPVVVFSHGLSSSRWIHNTTCAALAQQGYVVIAPEHAYVL